jgi:hypothetical protein
MSSLNPQNQGINNMILNTQGSFQQSQSNPKNQNNTNYFPSTSINPLKTLSTREYIQSTVMTDLTQGMYKLSKEKPENPLEYLGNYLLSQSKLKEK